MHVPFVVVIHVPSISHHHTMMGFSLHVISLPYDFKTVPTSKHSPLLVIANFYGKKNHPFYPIAEQTDNTC